MNDEYYINDNTFEYKEIKRKKQTSILKSGRKTNLLNYSKEEIDKYYNKNNEYQKESLQYQYNDNKYKKNKSVYKNLIKWLIPNASKPIKDYTAMDVFVNLFKILIILCLIRVIIAIILVLIAITPKLLQYAFWYFKDKFTN